MNRGGKKLIETVFIKLKVEVCLCCRKNNQFL